MQMYLQSVLGRQYLFHRQRSHQRASNSDSSSTRCRGKRFRIVSRPQKGLIGIDCWPPWNSITRCLRLPNMSSDPPKETVGSRMESA